MRHCRRIARLAGLLPGFRSPSKFTVPVPVKVPAPVTEPKKTVNPPGLVWISPWFVTSSKNVVGPPPEEIILPPSGVGNVTNDIRHAAEVHDALVRQSGSNERAISRNESAGTIGEVLGELKLAAIEIDVARVRVARAGEL